MRRTLSIFISLILLIPNHFVFAETDKAGDSFKIDDKLAEKIGNAADEAAERKNSADSDGLEIEESTNLALAVKSLMSILWELPEAESNKIQKELELRLKAIQTQNLVASAMTKQSPVALKKIETRGPYVNKNNVQPASDYTLVEQISPALNPVKVQPIPADLTNSINFLKQYQLLIKPRRKYETAITNGAEDFISKKSNCTVNFKKANGSCGPKQSDTMKELMKAMTAGNVLKQGLGVNEQCSILSGLGDVASFGFLMYNFRCSSIRTMCNSSCSKAKQKANYLLQAVKSYKQVIEQDTNNTNSCTFIAKIKASPESQKASLNQIQTARLKSMSDFITQVKLNKTECSAKYSSQQTQFIDSSFDCNSFTNADPTKAIACTKLATSCKAAQTAEKNYQSAYQNIKLQEKQNEMLIRINEKGDGFTIHRMTFNPFASGEGGLFKKEVPVTQLSNPMPDYSQNPENPEGIDAPIQLGTNPVIVNPEIVGILKGACENLKNHLRTNINNLPVYNGKGALEAEMNQQEKQGEATVSVSGKANICESDYGSLLMNSLGMLASMRNMKSQAEACKKATDAGQGKSADVCSAAGIKDIEFCKVCSDPKLAAQNPQCKCNENQNAPECKSLTTNSLRGFTPTSVNPNAKPGDALADANKILQNFGADGGKSAPDFGANAASGGGGGGVGGNVGGSAPGGGSSGGGGSGSGGGGSGGGAGGTGEEQTADILSGFQSGGGGSGWGSGGGAGGNSAYRDYLPGGAKDPESDQLQARREITPSGGKSVWEKVHERYQDNKKSLLD